MFSLAPKKLEHDPIIIYWITSICRLGSLCQAVFGRNHGSRLLQWTSFFCETDHFSYLSHKINFSAPLRSLLFKGLSFLVVELPDSVDICRYKYYHIIIYIYI